MSETAVDDMYLADDGFNPTEYVNEFLRNVKSGEEVKKLQQLKTSLNGKNASFSESIKDIVFERYRQFIDTSKEVSHLERDIYQLSTHLMDQKHLIESMMEKIGHEKDMSQNKSSSISHAAPQPQNPLQLLIQKLDGVAGVLNSSQETNKILLQNEMMLLNQDTMEQVHSVLLVLLTDTLLVGFPSDSSKFRFQVESVHPLDSIAVVNVKRPTGARTANDQVLQFLIFPDQLYVKCESPKVKREWFEGVEQAKRKQQHEDSLHRQATIRAKRKSVAAQGNALPVKSHLLGDAIQEEDLDTTSEVEKQETEKLLQWLEDLIDEVENAISQREMERAVELINEWRESGCQDAAINGKWTAIERVVVRLLSDEVKSPGALHGNSNLIHKNMELLCSLNRATYAMDLFLKRRSKALRHAADELAVSEEPLSYIKQISAIFINGILDVAKGALSQPDSLCQMLQFASSELKLLLSLVRRNVVEVAPTMAVLAHTWRILLEQSRRLAESGLDLTFEVHRLLAPSLQSALENNFINIFEAVKHRISEEKWRPYTLESELALNRYLEEMSDLGLSIDWAVPVAPKYCLNLAHSACQFARVAYALSRDLGILHASSSQLDRISDGFIVKLWKEYLTFLVETAEKFLAAPGNATLQNVHALTCQFLVSQVLPLCEETYEDGCGLLTELLNTEYPSLCEYVVKDDSSYEEVANV